MLQVRRRRQWGGPRRAVWQRQGSAERSEKRDREEITKKAARGSQIRFFEQQQPTDRVCEGLGRRAPKREEGREQRKQRRETREERKWPQARFAAFLQGRRRAGWWRKGSVPREGKRKSAKKSTHSSEEGPITARSSEEGPRTETCKEQFISPKKKQRRGK